MKSYRVPQDRLNLFLIALDMNFNSPKPDYIFQTVLTENQVPSYDVVILTKHESDKIITFVESIWLEYFNRGKHDNT